MWRNQQQISNFNRSGFIQSVVITSDPQYPWTDCTMGVPFQNCNIGTVSPCNNFQENESTKEQRSEALIREQYNNINSYTDTVPYASVLINGDITAYGHGWQWDKMNHTLLPILKRPYYYGLGNHDIENNFNNCVNNGCFKNSLNYLQGHVRHYNLPSSQFDYSARPIVTWAGVGERREGSFAYAINFRNICSIQLQNNPHMNAFAGVSGTNSNEYHIFENRNWLENQLRSAKESGKIIIVNVHYNGFLNANYSSLLQEYGVVAVFSGHTHVDCGRVGSVGNIPHFRSGCAMLRTYLILEHFSDRLDIYAVNCNDWRNHRQLVGSITVPEPPEFDGTFQIAKDLTNNIVVDLNTGTNNVTLWSNHGGSNQRWNFTYNRPKDAYILRSVSDQRLVLAWNVSSFNRNVFATPGPSLDEHYWILSRYRLSDGYGTVFRNKKDPNMILGTEGGGTSSGTNLIVSQGGVYGNQIFFVR
ncbi:metallophosphoesterase [Bacillus thuringiensis]|uniref:metallophosphoesterase n=1 Tax=Bacillus thuringiensis TaxID=1428 RepID=UPI003D097CDA